MIARPTFFGPAVVIAVISAVIGAFWVTFSHLVGLSENAEGSAHTTFVFAAFLVLLWGARTGISTLPIRPFLPGILGLFAAGLIWLTGELIFARVLTYIGIMAMIPMAIDFSLGFFHIWENTHISRLLTGGILGFACAVYIVPAFADIVKQIKGFKVKGKG